MPLDWRHLAAVGFILNEQGVPIGTGFAVGMASEQTETHPTLRFHYVVTANHVVEGEPHTSVRFRSPDGVVVDSPALDWEPHGALDVAVAPLDPRADGRIGFAVSMDTQAMDTQPNFLPTFGAPVYYVGLFAPSKNLGTAGIPLVRSGTVAMNYAPIEKSANPYDGYDVVHLIDCRSYSGFSGSPVFVQMTHPGPAAPGRVLGLPMYEHLEGADQLGDMYYVTLLYGMIMDHYQKGENDPLGSRVGIGVVLPIEHVREVLMGKKLTNMRREYEDEHPDENDGVERVQTKAVPQEPPFGRADFLRDLLKATKREEPPEQEG